MPLFGFMAIVPTRRPAIDLHSRVSEVSTLIRQALVIAGIQGKALADRMGLSESHLSRQLNEQGVNLARLANAGPDVWALMLKPLCDLVGLKRERVLTIFGAESDVERDEREKQRDAEIAELRRQIADILKRLPPAKSDDSETRVA